MGSSDKFCLRWNDFETNISAAFQELRNDEDFFDVTLCCGPDGTDRLRAHKVILSACSPFFRGILKNNPHANPLIYLRGVTMEDLNALLNFMYHGEANVTQEDLNSFLAVAEDLDVKGLTSNDQEKATKRAGVDTAKFKRKSSGGAVSAKKRKVEDETAFDEGSAVVKSETVSDDTFADDFSLEESYADEEGGNGDYDKSAGDDLEDYGEEGDPVAGTSSDGAKVAEMCSEGTNFEVVEGFRANTLIYVDKSDGYGYVKEGGGTHSIFLRCRWCNKGKETSKCPARAILKLDESTGQYRLTRTKDHNCDPERQGFPNRKK